MRVAQTNYQIYVMRVSHQKIQSLCRESGTPKNNQIYVVTVAHNKVDIVGTDRKAIATDTGIATIALV